MKKETLEKIRNFLEYLFVLFMSILIMLITFGSLHVHAGFVDSIPDNYNAVNMSAYNSFCLNDGESSSKYPDYPYNISENITMYVPDDVFVGCYQKNDYSNFNVSNGPVSFILLSKQPFTSYYYVSGGSNDGKVCASVANYNSTYGFYAGSTIFKHSYGVDGQSQFDYSHVDDSKFSHTIFRYSTDDELYQYFSDVAAGKIDNTNKPDIDNPDFEDTAYAFTGFTANNKMTATWTGTTERSYLQNQEVEEYVRVNYYFADKEAQDTIKQADAYPDEFATADKTLTIDVSGLKPDDENWFLRYIRITPCYRQAGLGAWGDFYHGLDVYVYFDVKGNIEKVIQKSKPTDLNKGNMVYDSSIGYLQNVIYTEQKSHDGSGRQATFKWSTLKSLPDDAQIEIVAQNFYIEWFNKKTEENFIYKEYGEDCFYSAGSYSFNANTPVWTWLKEKEIDPFSIKTQSYGSTEYYLRIVVYNDSDSLYHYGGWVKVDIKSKDTTIMPSTDVETGGFDDSSGLWNQDTASSDSYHYSTDDKGKLTGNIDVNSWEDLNMNSFTWMYRNMQSMVSSLGEFPAMVNAVFGYLPVQYITSIGVLLVAIVLLRFLGR